MSLTQAIEAVPLWYHTLELPGGVLTPGWFDLRGVVQKLPWPDVRGLRCLDVGTYDGFYAFELERRGAAEVVAIDIPSQSDWDLAPVTAARAAQALAAATGEKGAGFDLACDALGSRVERRWMSVYELGPAEVGQFDLVVCGSLLLHLRDPVRAVEAIHSVCSGWLMSVEEVSLPLSVLFRRRAVAEMRFSANPTQWWVTNARGHRRLLESSGFEIERAEWPWAVPFGAGHAPLGGGLRTTATRVSRRALTGEDGVPHQALLARPGS